MTKEQFRQEVLANAIADIGKGEEGQNNWGPYVKGLLASVGINEPAAWCAAAVVRWITLAMMGLTEERMISYPHYQEVISIYSPSAKAMFNAARELGWVLPPGELPQPGDIGITKRTAYDSHGNVIDWLAHAFMVESFDPLLSTIDTIEGNVGKFPAKVRRFTALYNAAKNRIEYGDRTNELYGFIRLLGKEE